MNHFPVPIQRDCFRENVGVGSLEVSEPMKLYLIDRTWGSKSVVCKTWEIDSGWFLLPEGCIWPSVRAVASLDIMNTVFDQRSWNPLDPFCKVQTKRHVCAQKLSFRGHPSVAARVGLLCLLAITHEVR